MPARIARCYAVTHVGRIRSGNEDTIAVSGCSSFPMLRWEGALPLETGWALVADGMGGHVAGEVASQLAVEFLRPIMSRLQTPDEFHQAVNATNLALYDTMRRHPEFDGFGTTIVGVCLRSRDASFFNVGDSRAYLFDAARLTQLPQDDMVAGHMLTQCLGGSNTPTSLNAHVCSVPLAAGTTLLLCSDGLSNMVADNDIARILAAKSRNPAELLLRAALEAGGIDNVSTIVIEIL